MSQGPLCPNLTKKVQKEVSQMANHNLPCVMLKGGLSVNLNHLKMRYHWVNGTSHAVFSTWPPNNFDQIVYGRM